MLEKWVDENGNAKVDEKGNYTTFATNEDIEYGEALRNSGPDGEAQFDYLVSSKAQNIQIDFLPVDMGGENLYYMGQIYNNFNTDKNGNVTKINSSRIEIYKNTSISLVADINKGKLRTGEKIEGDYKIIKDKKLKPIDNIISIISHELGHTTKENQQMMIDEKKSTYKYDPNKDNSETIPEQNRTNILKQVKIQIK